MQKIKLFLLILLISMSTLILAQDFEGFETGNFSAYEWQLSGNANWFVTNNSPYGGNFCAQGGDISDNQTTALQVTRDITDNGTINFYWKVSSESNYDYLRFYLDGTQIQEISGTVGWTQVTTNVSSGSHTFKWEYSKDVSISTGSDTGWIDNIIFPPTITYDNDLAGMSITGNTVVNAGNTENYNITVKNVGNNAQNTYTVKLYKGNGEELSSIDISQTIVPDESVVHNLVWNVPVDEPIGMVEIYGKVFLTGDENTANDETNTLNVEVFPPGIIEITVGDGTDNNNRTPLSFQYKNSLTEIIYLADELTGAEGMITALTYYNNFTSNLLNKPTVIWLGETTQTNLTNGWIPSTSLTEVFNGTINYPSGTNSVTIQLTTPYFYNGSNLVVMAFRPMDTQGYGTTDYFIHDTTLEHEDRTRYQRDDFEILDPANPPEVSFTNEYFANTTFTFFLGAMGEVEGYVYDDDGNPLEGALVTIEETQTVTYTDVTGYYHFGNVITGVYDFTADMQGYSPQTVTGEVIEDEVAQVDFNLIPLGVVIVSGHIVGSDFPEIGLENALIEITGFANYQATTNANGDFIIEDVFTNITYDIQISFEGYDNYSDEISVGSTALDIGTIILNELAYPPGNVQAIQNPIGTEVALSWSSPGQGGGEFRYDDGDFAFQLGYNSTPANAVFGAIHPNVAVVQKIHWYLSSQYGSHDQVKLYLFGLDTNDEPNAAVVLYESGYIDNIDDEWNIHLITDPVEAFEGFFVGVSTPNEYTSIGMDDGVGEPWEFQVGTQFCKENWTSAGNWTEVSTFGPNYERNLMIRAYGINMGNTCTETVEIPELKFKSNTLESRGFESYNIYRFYDSQHNNPGSWQLIAEGVEDTVYVDLAWIYLPNATYQFAIRSVYTNGVESIPSFSDYVVKTSASTEDLPHLTIQLKANYPNPFNPATTIVFELNSGNIVDIEVVIYNVKGQKVRQLVSGQLSAGQHSVVWDGKDENKQSVSSGVYYYRLLADDKIIGTKRMLLLK